MFDIKLDKQKRLEEKRRANEEALGNPFDELEEEGIQEDRRPIVNVEQEQPIKPPEETEVPMKPEYKKHLNDHLNENHDVQIEDNEDEDNEDEDNEEFNIKSQVNVKPNKEFNSDKTKSIIKQTPVLNEEVDEVIESDRQNTVFKQGNVGTKDSNPVPIEEDYEKGSDSIQVLEHNQDVEKKEKPQVQVSNESNKQSETKHKLGENPFECEATDNRSNQPVEQEVKEKQPKNSPEKEEVVNDCDVEEDDYDSFW